MRISLIMPIGLVALLLPAFLSIPAHGQVPSNLFNYDSGDWLIGALLDCGPPSQTHYGQISPFGRPAKDLVLQCTTDVWRKVIDTENRVWRMDYEDRPYECWNCNCAVWTCKIANGKMPYTPMLLGTSVQHFWAGVETAGRTCACNQVFPPCFDNAIKSVSPTREYAPDTEQQYAMASSLLSSNRENLPTMAKVSAPVQVTLSQEHTNQYQDWYPTANNTYLIGSIEGYCDKYNHYIYVPTGGDPKRGALRCYDVQGWQFAGTNENKIWSFDGIKYNCHTDQVVTCRGSTVGHNVNLVQMIGNSMLYWEWAGVTDFIGRWSTCTKQAATTDNTLAL